ncbi:MAG: energy transducer TonB [Bryobacteraceae bacterium]
MNEPSERIRAALRKSPATRATETTQDEENISQLPDVAISTENLEAFLAAKPKQLAPAQAVEVLLPMLGASDEQRLKMADQEAHPEETHPAKPLIPEHTGSVVPVGQASAVAENEVGAAAKERAQSEKAQSKPADLIVDAAVSVVKPEVRVPVEAPKLPSATVKLPEPAESKEVSSAPEPAHAERPLQTPSYGSTLFAEGPPPPSDEELARQESRKQFIRWIAPGIVLLLLASGTTTYLLMSRQSSAQKAAANTAAAAPVTASAPVAPVPLQLDVELQTNGQINVRWNPSAEKVAKAAQGRLVVTEENQPARVMQLTRGQLGIGHFSYQPSGERMEFRLEVVDSKGVVAQESVLAMSPKAAAAVPPAARATNNVPDTQPAKPSAVQQPAAVTTSREAPAPAATRTAARAFLPPVNTSGQDIRTVILEPPTIATTAGALPAGIATPQSFNAISATPPPAAAAPQQIRVGGNIQSGLLIKRVTPEYPPMARSARVQGIVRFSAVIGKDGRIRDLQVAGGPQLLIQPATAAVKQWVYRPTMLNGQPVEVATQIEVNFTLGQQ